MWKYFEKKSPCPYGCLMKQRTVSPYDYVLTGDCRVPWADDCCLNKQEKIDDFQRDAD